MKNVILFLMICMPYFTMAQSPCALDNTFSGDGKIISDASRLAEHIIALPNGQSIVAYNAFGNGHVYL